jgi:hypothetical protein
MRLPPSVIGLVQLHGLPQRRELRRGVVQERVDQGYRRLRSPRPQRRDESAEDVGVDGGSRGNLGRAVVATKSLDQLVQADGFGEVVVHPRPQAQLALLPAAPWPSPR